MAAVGTRLSAPRSARACIICKSRKKKCCRSLPSCGYCTRKTLDCVYAHVRRSHNGPTIDPADGPSPVLRAPRPPLDLVSPGKILSLDNVADPTKTDADETQVYSTVHNIIRSTNQFVDDITSRYFQTFHRHLPILSRTRFYDNLTTGGVAPTAETSILLLMMCLSTLSPALGYESGNAAASHLDQHTIYLTARSILTQVQVTCPPSIPLIQAGLLLAVYEYTHQRPEDAFITISSSIRMAYAARIHNVNPQMHLVPNTSQYAYRDLLIQAEEASNTWWGIVVCERMFFSEVTVVDQPLATIFPSGDTRLPIEPSNLDSLDISDSGSLPNIPVTCLTSPDVGGFGRTVQATCLLNQVFKGFQNQDVDSKFLQLDRLDTNLQAFLSKVMPQVQGRKGAFCTAINIAIRALFVLHCHILDQQIASVSANFMSLGEWQKRSRDTLDTITRMVIETAESLISGCPDSSRINRVDTMPPTYPYIVLAALKHIGTTTQTVPDGWEERGQEVLLQSIDEYFKRFSVEYPRFEI